MYTGLESPEGSSLEAARIRMKDEGKIEVLRKGIEWEGNASREYGMISQGMGACTLVLPLDTIRLALYQPSKSGQYVHHISLSQIALMR
jgi:hypothetical protein